MKKKLEEYSEKICQNFENLWEKFLRNLGKLWIICIYVNFTKNLFKFYTCFSKTCRSVWQYDETQTGVENAYNKFS